MYPSAKKLPSVETLNELLIVDSSSPSGLTWKVNRGGTAMAGTKAGTVARSGAGVPYWNVKINGTLRQAHRVIWKMTNGKDPENVIDHIDNNPLNNNTSNLRDIPQGDNMARGRWGKEI